MKAPIFNILQEFCPTICDLIGEKNKLWNEISERYKTRIKFIKEEIKKNDETSFSRIFLDNWLLFKLGHEEPISFLKYFDEIVYEILNKVSCELHDKIKKILEQIIGNFDNEDGKRTFNSIGEIFVIDYYLKRNYSLCAIEIKLPNMNPIDFLFRNNTTNGNLLIEVTNIHPDKNKIESKDGLSTFFIHRYLDKYKNKSKDNINNAVRYDLKLFPIIWTDLSIIKKFRDFFIDTSSDISEEIHLLQGIVINDGNYQYFLSPVSKII